jgi:hypothetical protein
MEGPTGRLQGVVFPAGTGTFTGLERLTGMKKIAVVLLVIGVALVLSIGPAAVCRADETGLFTSIAPDAMIVIDLSGSMKWNPPGNHDSWNNPTYEYSDSACAGPFYDDNWHSGYTTYCSRFAIARRTLFSMLDDNHNGTIDSSDETSLNIRIGLGKFQGSTYAKLRDIAAKYSLIYCGDNTSCTIDQASGDSSNIRYWMSYSNVVGATPLVTGLASVKAYLDTHKANDTYKSCRQKFVILVSDGADTTSCGGAGYDTQADQYKRRREAVLATKALADAGYKVFVIGMGGSSDPAYDMPLYLKRTLNWMAYYGGTDNPLIENDGDEAAFDPAAVSSCGSSSTTGPVTTRARTASPPPTTRGISTSRAMPSLPKTPTSSRRPSGRPSASSARPLIPSPRPPWHRLGSSTRTTSTRRPSSLSTVTLSGWDM